MAIANRAALAAALCLVLSAACRPVETSSPPPTPVNEPGAPPADSPGAGEPSELPTGATTCAALLCPENSDCVERDGRAECVPAGPSACAAVLCAEDTRCVERDGQAECVPIESAQAPCIRTGCSGQICSDQDVASTCEYREEYACYQKASCERQADGSCGWTATPELEACLSGR